MGVGEIRRQAREFRNSPNPQPKMKTLREKYDVSMAVKCRGSSERQGLASKEASRSASVTNGILISPIRVDGQTMD